MSKIRAYLDDVMKEMKKVSWPNRTELIGSTIVTLVATAGISIFIFVADRIIDSVLQFIYA